MKSGNMFFMTFFILVKTLYYYALACHTKGTKIAPKEKGSLRNFVNVSEPLDKYNWNKKSVGLSAQPIFFFNASKPNVAILPCFEDNIKLLSSSLTEQYANKNSYFTNSPTECQSVCQVTDKCNYFTYDFKTN